MMERRFSMNDFEHSLKEHADDFKMIPSKRVWHGIYNDMHPGRRWPSITMSLLLIFTLVVIGHINTHNGSKTVNSKDHNLHPNTVVSNLSSGESSTTNQKVASQKKVSPLADEITLAESQQKGVAPQESKNIDTRMIANKTEDSNSEDLVSQNSKAAIQSESSVFDKNVNSALQAATRSNNNFDIKNFDYNNIQLQDNSIKPIKSDEIIKENITADIENNLQSDHQISIENSKIISAKVDDNKNVQNTEQKKPNDLGKKLKQKKNDKVSWVYFVAPQVNSVSFNGQPIRPSK